MIASLTASPLMLVGVLVAVLVAYWIVVEYREADDTEEVAEGVGRRASATVQGSARYTRKATVGLAGLGAALGMEVLQLGAALNEILGGFPVVIGHVAYGAVSLLGITGRLPLDAQTIGFAFIFITTIALVLRATNDPEEI